MPFKKAVLEELLNLSLIHFWNADDVIAIILTGFFFLMDWSKHLYGTVKGHEKPRQFWKSTRRVPALPEIMAYNKTN